jgi:hypothetical protein
MDRDRNKDRDRDKNIDEDMDLTEIYAFGSDYQRKFDPRGTDTRPRGNLF